MASIYSNAQPTNMNQLRNNTNPKSTQAAADCVPLLGVEQDERHCGLSSVMGKAGGEGVAASQRPHESPYGKLEVAHLGLKPHPSLVRPGLTLSLGMEVEVDAL
jgi:hypothetical protein